MLSSRNNLTKLIIASILICLIFGLNALTQTKDDPPLDEETVSALVDELKEGLPEFIEDEDTVNKITEKWGAREDLAGKTKSQILKLLFEDVKSVITDAEITKNIWDKWNSGEKTESSPVETPKPQIWIKIFHNGAYIAHFDLTWDEPGKPNQSWKEHGKTVGWQQTINLRGGATNIRLKMQNDTGLVWQPQRLIFDRVLQPSDLNKCYRVTGTTLVSSWDNDCQ